MFSVFEWFVLVLWRDVFVLFRLMNQDRTKGKGWSTAGRPKAALWSFWLWPVVIYGYSRYI